MGSDVDVALCCGPQKKVAFTWEMIVCYGVPTVGRKRKVRGPHGGPEKESSPGRTDLVLPGIEVDLDVAQPFFLCQLYLVLSVTVYINIQYFPVWFYLLVER
jgi:hypothetical protein